MELFVAFPHCTPCVHVGTDSECRAVLAFVAIVCHLHAVSPSVWVAGSARCPPRWSHGACFALLTLAVVSRPLHPSGCAGLKGVSRRSTYGAAVCAWQVLPMLTKPSRSSSGVARRLDSSADASTLDALAIAAAIQSHRNGARRTFLSSPCSAVRTRSSPSCTYWFVMVLVELGRFSVQTCPLNC